MDDSTTLPEVRCRIELAESLQPFLDRATPPHHDLLLTVEELLRGLLQTLGIPGRPAAEIVAAETAVLYGGRFLRLVVNDSYCAYPDELLQRVHSYVTGTLPSPDATPETIHNWIESETAAEAHTNQARFLSLLCLEIVKLQPSLLLGEAQVQAYIASLPGVSPIAESTRLRAILGEVLDLWISLADRHKVFDVLTRSHTDDAEVREELIAALGADTIEVHVPQRVHDQLSPDVSGAESELVKFLRKGLFDELGLWLPRLDILPNPDPNDGNFAFKLNQVVTGRYVGLKIDQCLVNETADSLNLLSVLGQPSINPATGIPNAVVDISSKPTLESTGLTTWDAVGYLVLSLASALRRQAPCLVQTRVVEDQLNSLRPAFPALIAAVLVRYSLTEITGVLRAMAADNLPLRHLTRILERMLEFSLLPNDGLDLVAFTRSGIPRANGHKFARTTSTIVVYLLDPKIEAALTQPMDEQTAAAITQAVGNELARLPPTAQTPAVLTTARARPVLRKVLKQELPLVSVVAYDDISPALNVQPVARISLNPAH